MMDREELITRLEEAQQQCQRGISGYGQDLYYKVNDFCADLYGLLGVTIKELKKDE